MDGKGDMEDAGERDKRKQSFPWEQLSNFEMNDEDKNMTIKKKKLNLSLINPSTSQGSDSLLKFYWFDAIEDIGEVGTIYLFGKIHSNRKNQTEKYNSCCICIKDIPRKIYILPRNELSDGQKNTITDVEAEFRLIANRLKIGEYNSRIVKKKYAFELENIPAEAEYLEITYNPKYQSVPVGTIGKTIKHIFGNKTSCLEFFLTNKGIKGPLWLEIKSPNYMGDWKNISWCDFQIYCEIEDISIYRGNKILEIPPMTLTTLNIKIIPQTDKISQILMIGMTTYKNFEIDKPALQKVFLESYTFVTKSKNLSWPQFSEEKINTYKNSKIIKCDNEKNLLECFLDKLGQMSPDIIGGYDCLHQLKILIQRLFTLEVKNSNRLSKLKRHLKFVKREKFMLQHMLCRPICDILFSTKELYLKIKQTDLDSLSSQFLKTKIGAIKNIHPETYSQFFQSTEKLMELIDNIVMETSCMMNLICEMNIVQLAAEITSIVGNVISKTLSTNKNERNQFLLLHAFTEKGYIIPDKKSQCRGSESFSGGLVLDPLLGFHSKYVLLMDFNSLYPSIIQEYNLCFSTVPGIAYKSPNDIKLPDKNAPVGILPQEIRKIIKNRTKIKELSENPDLSAIVKMQYYIRQRALKLIANSIFGCLGSIYFRFYALSLASIITAKGREILLNAKKFVENNNFNVLYGDTDSIMIDTNVENYEEAVKIGNSIKHQINSLYNSIQLDVQDIYKYLIVVGKKQYTGLIVKKNNDGTLKKDVYLNLMEFLRNDWCKLARDAGIYVTTEIFQDYTMHEKVMKIKNYLKNISNQVKEKEFNKLIPSLVMNTKLMKNPEDYAAVTAPHVFVALEFNKRNADSGQKLRAGNIVNFIYCNNGTNDSLFKRAYHISIQRKLKLEPDMNYYLVQQVMRAIKKVCDPIPQLNSTFLAKSLGIEEIYKKSELTKDKNCYINFYLKNEAKPFLFSCKGCFTENKIFDFTRTIRNKKVPFLEACISNNCKNLPYEYIDSIEQDLQKNIGDLLNEYKSSKMTVCSFDNCDNDFKFVDEKIATIGSLCAKCKQGTFRIEETSPIIHGQLKFYLKCFDVDKQSEPLRQMLDENLLRCYRRLKDIVEKYLNECDYEMVVLDDIPW